MKISIVLEALTADFETDINRSMNRARRDIEAASRDVQRLTGQIAAGLAVAAAAGGAMVASMVREGLQIGDALAKQADRVGVTAEAWAGLSHQAKLSGTSIESVQTAFVRMARVIDDSRKGTGEASDAVRRLGLSYTELAVMAPEQQFAVIADRLNDLGSRTEKLAIAQQLFGRGAAEISAVLDEGSAGMARYRAEVERFGGALSRFDLAKIEAANNEFARVAKSIEGASLQLTAALAPTLAATAKAFTEVTLNNDQFRASLVDTVEVSITGFGKMITWAQAWGRVITVTGQAQALQFAAFRQGIAFLMRDTAKMEETAFIMKEAMAAIDNALLEPLDTGKKFVAKLREIRTEIERTAAAAADQAGLGLQIDPDALTGMADVKVDYTLDLESFQAQAAQLVAIQESAFLQAAESQAAIQATIEEATLAGQERFGQGLTDMIVQQAIDRVNAEYEAAVAAKEALGIPVTEDDQLEQAMRLQDAVTQATQDALQKRQAMQQQFAQREIELDREVARNKMTVQNAAANAVGSVLRSLFGTTQLVSLAMIALQTKMALGQATQNNIVAQQVALAQLGPIFGPPAAASIAATLPAALAAIKTAGVLNAVASVASGLGGGSFGGGGGFGGGGTLPDFRDDAYDSQDGGMQRQQAVQVHFHGDMIGWDRHIEERVIAGIRDAVENRDVVIFTQSSRQAMEYS